MKFEVIGGAFPAAKCILDKDECMKTEGGSMAWMDRNITMSTEGGGGIGKALGRAISGENIFFNRYEAKEDNCEIVFASSFPGRIVPVELKEGQSIVAQKGAFLACEASVDVAIHFNKKMSGGLFGGMGFIFQKFTGPGTVFFEVDGGLEEYLLEAGEEKVVDGPHLALLESTVKFDVEKVKGMKNIMFGGEGLFNTVVHGPGRIWLQTMPIANMAGEIGKFIPTNN